MDKLDHLLALKREADEYESRANRIKRAIDFLGEKRRASGVVFVLKASNNTLQSINSIVADIVITEVYETLKKHKAEIYRLTELRMEAEMRAIKQEAAFKKAVVEASILEVGKC